MNRDLEMVIRLPKEMEQDFRLFIVTHGGSIEKCTENIIEHKHKKCGECKHLNLSDKCSIGYKCECDKEWKSKSACRRQKSTPACKCFEQK